MQQLSSEAITMDKYLTLLKEQQPTLEWEEEHAEHSFMYKVRDQWAAALGCNPKGSWGDAALCNSLLV